MANTVRLFNKYLLKLLAADDVLEISTNFPSKIILSEWNKVNMIHSEIPESLINVGYDPELA
jgi:hypothetical protein